MLPRLVVVFCIVELVEIVIMSSDLCVRYELMAEGFSSKGNDSAAAVYFAKAASYAETTERWSCLRKKMLGAERQTDYRSRLR